MKIHKLLYFLLLVFLPVSAFAQVTVAPVSIHMTNQNKNGYLIIKNNSADFPQEVGIEIKFGYPKSDTAGNTYILFPDQVSDDDPAADKWVNFFPRKFILQPNEEQTVRIAAKPPAGIKDGEYWGRPIITSQAITKPVDTTGSEQISVGLTVQFRTVIALNFRKGKVTTGINITNLSGRSDNNKIILTADLKREGSAAYLGNIVTRIKNSKGDIVKENKEEVAVYYDLSRRMAFEIPNLAKGQYTAEIELNTDREEPGLEIIKGNTSKKEVTITVQ